MRLIFLFFVLPFICEGQIIRAEPFYTAPESGAANLLLDDYPGAAGAYSLRKLDKDYTGSAIRVRRSSDNTEQDIGFVNNYLDTAAMKTFVGANNGFVVTWYDQSGNSRNASQSTAANQPRVINAGAIDYEDGEIGLQFDGSNDFIQTDTASYGSTAYSILFVSKSKGLDATGRAILTLRNITGETNGFYHALIRNIISNNFRAAYTSNGATQNVFAQLATSTFPTVQTLVNSFVPTSGSITMYINDSLQDTDNAIGQTLTSTRLRIGTYFSDPPNTSYFHQGPIYEIIWYLSNEATNRSGINSNINAFYSIY